MLGGLFSSRSGQGLPFGAGLGLLISGASVAEHGPQGTRASRVVLCGPRCSVTHEILPGQGWNPCLLHWQAESLPLSQQGSLNNVLLPGNIS